MKPSKIRALVVGLSFAMAFAWSAGAQTPPGQDVPTDLVPLLAKPQSEMRIVVQRYATDRTTLAGNYVGGGGGGRGGGRAGGAGAVAAPDNAPGAAAAPVALSTARIARLKRFDLEWQTALARIDGSRLSSAARADLDSLKSTVQANLTLLETETAAIAQVTPLAPFGAALVQLLESRLRLEDVQPQKAAGVLTQVTREIGQMQARLEAGLGSGSAPNPVRVDRELAVRSAETVASLRGAVTAWFNFYNGYDPLFTWWMGLPYKHVDEALGRYSALLREKVAPAGHTSSLGPPAPLSIPAAPAPKFSSVPDLNEILALPQDETTDIVQRFNTSGGGGGRGRGGGAPRTREFYTAWLAALKTLDFDKLSRNAQVDYLYVRKTSESAIARMDFKPQANIPRKTDNSGIPGPARGRDGLILDLLDEMIPYTPEQLIALANREFTWQEAEMKKASRALGFGDDWKKAIEKVKDSHAAPGQQPGVIRDLLYEAIDYLRTKDLITVPQVAAESLRMSMMSPERQLVNPFFTGGAQITVSYPTNTMEYEARLQSMRGNTTDFSHATAHHEMIPGHNLVGYMGGRFGQYRPRIGGGGTPFFGEGWAVYWETILYDMGFHDSPGERIGALFWLMHRSARIIFSLNFHMGIWSPQECIDFLVEKVGHERDNATAEVRRSFDPAAGYGPLYQAAYLLGALQLRGLRQELVDSRQMTQKQFHDEIMRQGSMPINYLRLALTKQKLTRDMVIDWKFYGELPTK